MSAHDSHLRSLLSPTRSGTFFAPFRSRSANPEGFDSKMKLWICAIEEWTVMNKTFIFSVKDIHQRFVSDSGIRPDKECVRLVLSEMKRRSRAVPLVSVRSSKLWSASSSATNIHPLIDHYIDPKGWFGWGVKNLVYNPASWAVSALTSNEDQCYSDLTDMSIQDDLQFVCQRSLHELSQRLREELIRVSKAEKQSCFEWQHLIELIAPILNTIIDAIDSKELYSMLDLLMEYLVCTKRIAILVDNETKLVKVTHSNDDSSDEELSITKKDIAMARLLRAKELLTADADKYHDLALRAKENALDCYKRNEIAKSKSLLRSHKRLTECAEQKEGQLTNVEIMLDQLENTNSNMLILQAYKDGADALRIANTNLESNTSILDDMYDVTAEARYLNEGMNQMLNDISRVSRAHDVSNMELEDELNAFLNDQTSMSHQATPSKLATRTKNEPGIETTTTSQQAQEASVDDLEERLNNLLVCQDPIPDEITPREDARHESTPAKTRLVSERLPAT